MDIGKPERVIEVAPPQEFPAEPVTAPEPVKKPEPVPSDT